METPRSLEIDTAIVALILAQTLTPINFCRLITAAIHSQMHGITAQSRVTIQTRVLVMNTIQSPLLNEQEASEYLRIAVATLRRWRWAGKPPRFLKIGAAVRYDPADLAAFIEAARRTSTSDTGRTL